MKYLVLGGSTSAFLLFGMALVYAVTGKMTPAALVATLHGGSGVDLMVVTGIVLILVGVGFKLAVVPFHMWTPDIYQGAPAPVTAFIATVSKTAVVALLLRFFRPVTVDHTSALFLVFAGISIASMLAGNLLALRQNNVKRILAYSSIAHLGYILVAFLAAGRNGTVAVTFYLVAYTATNLAAFGVVGVLSTADGDAEDIALYRGLGRRRPWLAAVFAVALLSLAGIPLTAGFIGKFYLITAGAGASLWVLVVVLVVSSTIGLYYYTRLIVDHVRARARRRGPGPPGRAGGLRPGRHERAHAGAGRVSGSAAAPHRARRLRAAVRRRLRAPPRPWCRPCALCAPPIPRMAVSRRGLAPAKSHRRGTTVAMERQATRPRGQRRSRRRDRQGGPRGLGRARATGRAATPPPPRTRPPYPPPSCISSATGATHRRRTSRARSLRQAIDLYRRARGSREEAPAAKVVAALYLLLVSDGDPLTAQERLSLEDCLQPPLDAPRHAA